jgi:gamma-glutamylcyclotransferase (GGCT)/AIG2-like uncharacterized protein YtfP
MTIYFAYGANIDPVHMAVHCPSARRLGVAVLRGHAFGIAAGGFGTVRPDPESAVQGVLWELTPADEASLDKFEDVDAGFYHKDTVLAERRNGERVPAMIYRPVDDTPGRPNPGYLERIVEVGGSLDFPPDYLARLIAQGAPDPN